MIKVSQIKLKTNLNVVNDLGWNRACMVYPDIEAYFETQTGSNGYTPRFDEFYEEVAHIDTDDMEFAFNLMNLPAEAFNPEDAAKLTKITPMHSMSVGDIVETENGTRFMVEPFGFKELVA